VRSGARRLQRNARERRDDARAGLDRSSQIAGDFGLAAGTAAVGDRQFQYPQSCARRPHLHFEILSNGKAVDPLVYSEIKREQLGGADLERFRNQVKHARAERDLETTAGIHNSVPGIAYFTDISTR